MADTSQVREMWEAFLASNEIDEVEAAFDSLLQFTSTTSLRGQGLSLFYALREKLLPDLNFRQKRLLTDMDLQISKRKTLVQKMRAEYMQEGETDASQSVRQGDLLICGAGPCGLRAAIEAGMLGFKTTVVEKRTAFSRANILMLWERTWNDVMSLGAKQYMPKLPPCARESGVSFYMGTRELQLIFLKTALLCGVAVWYGKELVGLMPPKNAGDRWQGCIKDFVKATKPNDGEVMSNLEAVAALEGLKAIGKTDDYQKTYKCNAMEHSDVDQGFVGGSCDESSETEVRVAFDGYIIAEGEWSNTTRKLGFDKLIDKFAQALGLVVNMTYDKTDPAQKCLQSFAGQKAELESAGIKYETVEYLKGDTHYIVVAIKKESLISYGALHEDRQNSKQLLQVDNVNMEKLKTLGKIIAEACGLPSHVDFYPHNPIQLFDYSSRARCLECVKLLSGGVTQPARVCSATNAITTQAILAAQSGESGYPAFVMPIGDALVEPFWPQGLGSNRGFHTALNAVFTALCTRESCLQHAMAEARFAYQMLVLTQFHGGDLLPFDSWTADTMSRFVPNLMGLARDRIRKKGSEEDDLPARIAKLKMTMYG